MSGRFCSGLCRRVDILIGGCFRICLDRRFGIYFSVRFGVCLNMGFNFFLSRDFGIRLGRRFLLDLDGRFGIRLGRRFLLDLDGRFHGIRFGCCLCIRLDGRFIRLLRQRHGLQCRNRLRGRILLRRGGFRIGDCCFRQRRAARTAARPLYDRYRRLRRFLANLSRVAALSRRGRLGLRRFRTRRYHARGVQVVRLAVPRFAAGFIILVKAIAVCGLISAHGIARPHGRALLRHDLGALYRKDALFDFRRRRAALHAPLLHRRAAGAAHRRAAHLLIDRFGLYNGRIALVLHALENQLHDHRLAGARRNAHPILLRDFSQLKNALLI